MQLRPCRLVALITASGFCSISLAPAAQSGARESVWAAFEHGAVLAAPASPPAELLAFDMNRVVTTQMRFIRYEATAYQRQVAEARARAYVAAQRRAIAQAHASSKPTTPAGKSIRKPKKVAPASQIAEPKPLPRYIAVDTVKDKRASPKARKVVMIWDTHADALVGNNIYDVESPPDLGTETKFETYSAEYVGAGL